MQNLKKETGTHLLQFQLLIFYKLASLQKTVQRMNTIHSGIFRRRALWAATRRNTIASRDQLKPIKIGQNLMVNYKGW